MVVNTNENYKKHMCIDYSQTVNKFTLQNGYPPPRMQDIVNKVSQYNVFSTLDWKSAYNQVELSADNRILSYLLHLKQMANSFNLYDSHLV